MESPLVELPGYLVVIDCLTANCAGQRSYAIDDLARWPGRGRKTVAQVIGLLRCTTCRGRARAAWIATGPALNKRMRPRRVALVGPEVTD